MVPLFVFLLLLMLTIAECKEILGEDVSSISDDEILVVRDALYALAELAIDKQSNTNHFDFHAGFGQKDGIPPPKTDMRTGRCHDPKPGE